MDKIQTPNQIKENNKGIYEVIGNYRDILRYLNDELDMKEFKDYVFVANQFIEDSIRRYPFMVHFVSNKGLARFVQSGVGHARHNGVTIVRKWTIPDLKKVNYSLWR